MFNLIDGSAKSPMLSDAYYGMLPTSVLPEVPDSLKVRDILLQKVNTIGEYLESRGYTYLGAGRHRKGYRSPNGKWVVKVPNVSEWDDENDIRRMFAANIQESQIAKGLSSHKLTSEFEGVEVAKSRLRVIQDIPILVMESVMDWRTVNGEDESRYFPDGRPGWAYRMDGSQVGVNRKGKIVAYDYTSNL